MSANPISALDALMSSPRRFGAMTVYPLTIQRLAALELLGSPLVGAGAGKWELFDVLTAIWAATSSALELRNVDSASTEKIKARIWQWASHSRKAIKENSTAIIEDILRQMKLLSYLIPEFAEESVTAGKTTSNGWLVQTAYIATAEFGIALQTAIEETPAVQLMLMRRQKLYNEAEGRIMTLEDKEMMDRFDARLASRKNDDGRRHA